jgi:hypothetical protein
MRANESVLLSGSKLTEQAGDGRKRDALGLAWGTWE